MTSYTADNENRSHVSDRNSSDSMDIADVQEGELSHPSPVSDDELNGCSPVFIINLPVKQEPGDREEDTRGVSAVIVALLCDLVPLKILV